MADSRKIYLTDQDLNRLQELVALSHGNSDVEALEDELNRAIVVTQEMIPPDVVTMNSTVRFRDMTSSKEMEVTLVYPKDSDMGKGRLSVMAPVGMALIGLSVGQSVEWPLPQGGVKRLKILSILYQPEASGDWNL
ncbi:MAG TPA: nucleoside diphosphate kinase regulator [bacterium]|nr:nucleoside diphosphate kinase regulator [bacterium]